jgi:hypothetical protein
MTQSPSASTAAPLSLFQRYVGIIVSPKSTFASVVSYPRWLGMTLLVTYIAVGAQFVFTSTETGKLASLEQQIDMMERFGQKVTPEAEAQMRASIDKPLTRAIPLVVGPILGIVFTALIAGILFGVFAVTGGTASFKQVMAVAAHAGVISSLSALFSLPFWFMKGSMSGVTNLGALWVGDERAFVARFLGTIDLFWLWYVFVLAVGLAVLYRRRTQPIVIALLGVYMVIAGVIATAMAAFGGS